MSPDDRTVRCPHCRKGFHADLLGPETERAGFKCPHCNLFVPVGRTEEPQHADSAA